nr:putative late blight resistance protein homolog R1A-10 [Nicotiana tomentosiformis]
MLLSLLQNANGVKVKISTQDLGNDKVSAEDMVETKNAELADLLQKSFKGKRYLIIVDDIWSREAWDEIRLWFPENNNRSWILLTTRIMEVALYASSPKDPFPMRPLNPKKSWDLFFQEAFGKKDCPIKFKNVAKAVVENCKGLPLIISVVAATLSSKRTLDEWNEVAQSASSLVNLDSYQHCSRVLALSYYHLPSHLKACFLYFGVFAKASDISVKKLIRLWTAEGLFELRGLEELENVAGNLLHDLIDKSLVVVSKR